MADVTVAVRFPNGTVRPMSEKIAKRLEEKGRLEILKGEKPPVPPKAPLKKKAE